MKRQPRDVQVGQGNPEQNKHREPRSSKINKKSTLNRKMRASTYQDHCKSRSNKLLPIDRWILIFQISMSPNRSESLQSLLWLLELTKLCSHLMIPKGREEFQVSMMLQRIKTLNLLEGFQRRIQLKHKITRTKT